MLVQPRAITDGKYLAGLRIATYLCHWKEDLARIAITHVNALFWDKDELFRQVVNFSE